MKSIYKTNDGFIMVCKKTDKAIFIDPTYGDILDEIWTEYANDYSIEYSYPHPRYREVKITGPIDELIKFYEILFSKTQNPKFTSAIFLIRSIEKELDSLIEAGRNLMIMPQSYLERFPDYPSPRH